MKPISMKEELRVELKKIIIQIKQEINQHQQQQYVSHRWSNILPRFLHRMEFDLV